MNIKELLVRARLVVFCVLMLGFMGLPPSSSAMDVGRVPAPTELTTMDGLEPSAEEAGHAGNESRPARTPIPFTMVGFRIPDGAEVRFRTSVDGQRWSSWSEAEPLDSGDGPDLDTSEAARSTDSDAATHSEPVWTGEARWVQTRVVGADTDQVPVHLIDAMGLSQSLGQRVSALARSIFRSAIAHADHHPGIITRAQWGADESWRTGSPSYAEVRFGVLHHTAGTNSYTREEAAGIVRGIYRYHTQVLGWDDIGYNLLVDRYGRVYEGRYGGIDRGVVGAHARGFNSGSFGIAVMGDFDVATPPSAAVDAVTRTIAWKYEVHGLDPHPDATLIHNSTQIRTLVGHRDVGSTACPGRYLYARLPTMRDRIRALVMRGAIPLVGDWNGNGTATSGWFKKGRFFLRNANSSGGANLVFGFGRSTDTPIVGDWNGDGTDTIGVFRDGAWYLRLRNSSGRHDLAFRYGTAGDTPTPGDWTGDRRSTPGIVRDRTWHLRFTNTSGVADRSFVYGRLTRGDLPLVGDWNANGKDTVGIVRDGEWHLRNALAGGGADIRFTYGRVTHGDKPLTGPWNGPDRSTPAVIRGSRWYLRYSNTGGPADVHFPYRG